MTGINFGIFGSKRMLSQLIFPPKLKLTEYAKTTI